MLKNKSPWWVLRLLLGVVGLFLLMVSSINLAWAQTSSDELQLAVHRDFGYGGFNNQIQGLFTLEATGLPLQSATFMIDAEVIGQVTAAPFKLSINTDKYPHGLHTFTVVGVTTDGRTLTSKPRQYEFVDASVGGQAGLKIGGSIAGVVLGIVALMLAFQFLPGYLGKRKMVPLGAHRTYGIKGGAICPKCGRPFGIHLMSINLFTRYFDRCEHCGKWSIVSRATPQQLADAEQIELAMAQPEKPVVTETAEAKLKRQIEETRYTDQP
jgi:hypothetical protein